MEFYKKLAAICCLLAVINVYGTNGAVTQWTGVTASRPADAVVANMAGLLAGGGGATGSADVSFRDGLTFFDGTQITVTATAATPTFTLDATSLNTFDIALGVISVKAGVTLSYASASTFTMTVTATHGGDTGDLTLDVTVNGMPTFSSTPLCRYIADATVAGTTLYTYTTADPDTPSTTVTTTISAGDTNSFFTTALTSGNLVTALAMDSAALSVMSLTIIAVDAGSPPSTASTIVAVLVTGTGTGTCSGGTVVIGSVMTTMALLITYFL